MSNAWEKPFLISEVHDTSDNWSLASDAKLLLLLGEYSKSLLSSVRNVDDNVIRISEFAETTNARLANICTDFSALSSIQFIENRVDDKEEAQVSEKAQVKSKEEDAVLDRCMKALKAGLETLDNQFQRVDIAPITSTDSPSDIPKSTIFVPINPYANRTMPALIGSLPFFADEYCGLGKSLHGRQQNFSSKLGHDQVFNVHSSPPSGSSPIPPPPPPPPPPPLSDKVLSPVGNSSTEEAVNIAHFPEGKGDENNTDVSEKEVHQPELSLTSDLFKDELFGRVTNNKDGADKSNSDNVRVSNDNIRQSNSEYDIGRNKKLNLVEAKPTNSLFDFSDEEEDEGEGGLFASTADNKERIFQSNMVFSQDENDIAEKEVAEHEENEDNDDRVRVDSNVSRRKLPTGAVSLFGTSSGLAEDLRSRFPQAISESDDSSNDSEMAFSAQHKSSEEAKAIGVKESPGQTKLPLPKSLLFSDSNEEENDDALFSANSTSVTRPTVSQNAPKQLKGTLFDDEDDNEDLFGSQDKPTPIKSKKPEGDKVKMAYSKTTKVVAANLFDDDDDDDDDLFGPGATFGGTKIDKKITPSFSHISEQDSGAFNADSVSNSAIPAEPVIKAVTEDPKTSSLFGYSDSDDDDMFSSRKPNSANEGKIDGIDNLFNTSKTSAHISNSVEAPEDKKLQKTISEQPSNFESSSKAAFKLVINPLALLPSVKPPVSTSAQISDSSRSSKNDFKTSDGKKVEIGGNAELGAVIDFNNSVHVETDMLPKKSRVIGPRRSKPSRWSKLSNNSNFPVPVGNESNDNLTAGSGLGYDTVPPIPDNSTTEVNKVPVEQKPVNIDNVDIDDIFAD